MTLLALVAALLSTGPAWAVPSNVAGNTAEFLHFGVGGRSLGMGDVAGPTVVGPDSMYWNPAGLAATGGPEFSFSHAELLQFFRHDYAGYAHPVEALGGTLGASVTMWTMDRLDARTASNVHVGEFAPHSEAFSIGYGRTFWKDSDLPARDREFFEDKYDMPFTPRPLHDEDRLWLGALRGGIAAKLISETIRTKTAISVAFDGGTQFIPFWAPDLTMSMTIRNIGSRPVFHKEQQTLPMTVDAGIAYDVHWEGHRVIPALEISVPYFGDPFAKLGAEYGVAAGKSTEIFFRAGYKTVAASYLNAVAGATVGIGFRVNRLKVDCGFQPMAELENVLRVSIGYRF
ncbi:MAG: hypothetical protein HY553_14375 [Elusimicrobia bacterium]|nr:hypothetical protein [Elusimicrobiota bacterium]